MSVIELQPAKAKTQGSERLLEVKDLRVTFSTPDGDVTTVNDLNFSLSAGDHFEITDPRCLAGHHRQRGIQRVELILVQFVDTPSFVCLKFAPAGEIGHLRDLQPVLDNRFRVDNWHALRRRHHRQRRSRQSENSGRNLELSDRE